MSVQGTQLRGEKARERVRISRQAETVQQAQVRRAIVVSSLVNQTPPVRLPFYAIA